jgi:hypothetical protein
LNYDKETYPKKVDNNNNSNNDNNDDTNNNNNSLSSFTSNTTPTFLSSTNNNNSTNNSNLTVNNSANSTITNNNNNIRDDKYKIDFLRIGQNLKLQTIIKGDAPTSQITSGAVKNELWEPTIFFQSFEYSINCSDSWNNWLVLGTNSGVFVLDEAIPWDTRKIFEKNISARQIEVCELFGLLFILWDKGYVSVFKLSELRQIMNDTNFNDTSSNAKTKLQCKENRLEAISGCHLYAIGKRTSNIRILAASGKKLTLLEIPLKSSSSQSAKEFCSTCISNSVNSISPGSSTTHLSSTSLHNNNNSFINEIENESSPVCSLFQIKKVYLFKILAILKL